MRKRLLISVMILLIAALIFGLCACNKNTEEKPGEKEFNGGEYETATYTVTYNAGGGTTNNDWKERVYNYGEKVLKPTYTPVKTGYVFLYWSVASNGTEFNFATSSVESDMTLYAVYQAAVVNHTYDLTAVLKKDGEIYSAETGQYTYGHMPQGNTKIQTQYGNSSSVLVVPYTDNPGLVNGIQDRFCFWYYLKAGKPERFSTMATATSTSVTVLKAYNETNGIELYPMWLSTLPKVSVTFMDSLSDDTYGTIDVVYGGSIDKSDGPLPEKAGYKFVSWTYTNTDEKEEEFFFADTDTNATVASEMVGFDYFDKNEVTVYANWRKEIVISSLSSYKAIYDKLRNENPTEDEQKEIDEILSAEIEITSIDFEGESLEALFDKDHVFKGTITGNNAGSKAVLSNGAFSGKESISVFGYVQGTVKNITVDASNTFSISTGYTDRIYIGAVATQLSSSSSSNKGLIYTCEATLNINIDGDYGELVIGGIVADNKGAVKESIATVNIVKLAASKISLGGIAGTSNASIEGNTVNITVTDLTASGVLKLGGIAASNSGSIIKGTATVNAAKIIAQSSVLFGGIAGENTSVIQQSSAVATLGTTDNKVTFGGTQAAPAYAGGLIGRNSGQLDNCFVTVDFHIFAGNDKDVLMTGGMVGENKSTSASSSAGEINFGYAVGTIDIKADSSKNITTYAAGIIGNNTQNNVSCLFCVVDIIADNEAGTNNVGYLEAQDKSTSSATRIYRASESVITKNGNVVSAAPDITVITNEKDLAEGNFKTNSTGFIFGTTSNAMKFDDKIWEIVTDGETYPTLK
ncbi:MAG: InlB B-repeat-containing protein [Clostridia bacterium]|nr:InlB B-repeat-containing protein [Clostridia bacterium]